MRIALPISTHCNPANRVFYCHQMCTWGFWILPPSFHPPRSTCMLCLRRRQSLGEGCWKTMLIHWRATVHIQMPCWGPQTTTKCLWPQLPGLQQHTLHRGLHCLLFPSMATATWPGQNRRESHQVVAMEVTMVRDAVIGEKTTC